jgi:hypothetical protein
VVVLLYIAVLVSFILGGAGIFSVDSWIISRKYPNAAETLWIKSEELIGEKF